MTAYYLMRVGQTALVPYYRPGDPAVADAIRGLAGQYSSVLLANHGPVVAGDSLEAAVFATEELEETAKLYLLLRGLNPRYLSPQQVERPRRDVRAQAVRHRPQPLTRFADAIPGATLDIPRLRTFAVLRG